MRGENKPLLQDHAGFLQEITPIAVEVGLEDKQQAVKYIPRDPENGKGVTVNRDTSS